MTRELIENIRTIIVPYMAHDLRRINYENMGEIDAEQFKEDMNEILDLAAKALEQQSIIDVSNVPHKIAEFFSNWDGDETAKMEISVNDMREVADVYRRKARAERQLKEKAQDYNPDEWCHDCKEYDHEKHCCPRYNRVIRNAVEEMKQPKTGHWIIRDDLATVRYYQCSECNEIDLEDSDYCPNCGAKMVEPQESEG